MLKQYVAVPFTTRVICCFDKVMMPYVKCLCTAGRDISFATGFTESSLAHYVLYYYGFQYV